MGKDVKMNDAKGSSNVSGESSNATSKEGVVPDKEMHLTGIYDLVAALIHNLESRYSFDLDDVFVALLLKYDFVEIRFRNYLNLVS